MEERRSLTLRRCDTPLCAMASGAPGVGRLSESSSECCAWLRTGDQYGALVATGIASSSMSVVTLSAPRDWRFRSPKMAECEGEGS